MANTEINTTATLTVNADPAVIERIRTAYRIDSTARGQSFDEWLLGIVLDWVEEVEKPAPVRDIGFGN